MCEFFKSIGSAISRAFTPQGTGGLEAMAQVNQALTQKSQEQIAASMFRQNQIAEENLTFAKQTQDEARKASAAALADQKLANDIARAASVPAVDSDAARTAGITRQRKLLAASPFGAKSGILKLGDAPLGYRTATGA